MTRQKRPLSAITKIVVHHAGSNDKYSTHESLAEHIKATNLGYHMTVDDDAVFKSKEAGSDGKATFKQQVPDDEVVWGAAGCNYNGWHISIDGNSETTGVTNDEINCLVQIIASKCKQWGWDKDRARKNIITHQYVGLSISRPRYMTACPGNPIIFRMPSIIERVCSYLPN